MNGLEFKADTHEYFFLGKRVPGVNECLTDAKILKPYTGDPYYGELGTAVHLAIEYYLKGTLDEESIDEQIRPRFEAFKKFWATQNEKPEFIEEPFTDGIFAGTPDLITRSCIYDWKNTAKHKKEDELKGQGYKCLLSVCGMPARDFVIVELHDDGTFAEFNYGDNWKMWPVIMKLRDWHNTPNSKRVKKWDGTKQPSL